eukprot:gene6607-biopygen1798
MTFANMQESGLEVGTATQEARHSPQVGRIPYRYIPSSCVDHMLSAMDSKTRQAFRSVSSSCRQSVHAYATTLRFESLSVCTVPELTCGFQGLEEAANMLQVSPRLESIPIPKCPNLRNLDIYHDYGKIWCFEGHFPASVRSLEVTLTVYEHLCNGALLECTELKKLTLHGSQAWQQMPPNLPCFSKLQKLNLHNFFHLTDVSALGSCTNLQTLNMTNCQQLLDVSTLKLANCIQLADVSVLASFTYLQTLKLANCIQLADVSVLASFTYLQTLKLANCIQLADVSVLASFTYLQTLKLAIAFQLADVSVLASFTYLQTLKLANCIQLADVVCLGFLYLPADSKEPSSCILQLADVSVLGFTLLPADF